MKKKLRILAVLVCAAVLTATPLSARAADAVTYTLRDDFGAAPLCRTIENTMERVELSDAHKPNTRYGFGVHLLPHSEGRGYITYDVTGVAQAEISAVVRQSNFGANHGWGLSLGVTDNVQDMPLNNVNNINLNNISPIYLSKEGRPFIFTENRWWGYLAEPKYSFAPSSLDVPNMLRAFTVPDEVGGEIDEDGFTVLKAGYLYPMLNLEYQTEDDGEWIPMVHSENNYRITAAKFLGGEKEYAVTVQVRNIPDTAVRVRVGADYIRQTLKPTSSADTEPDVYEDFPIAPEEGIYVTGVKLTLTQPYNGGFEQLTQTGIAVDHTSARRTFGLGEAYVADGLRFYDVMGEGVREESVDTDSFTVDASAYNAYKAGIYSITVRKDPYAPVSFFVEVVKPNELVVTVADGKDGVSASAPFSAEDLTVKARTNVGGVGSPDWKECVLPADKFTVDDSAVNYKKKGTYAVKVTVGEGNDAVSATVDVTVTSAPKKKKCGSTVAGAALPAGAALLAVAACAVVRRKKRSAAK